MLAHTETAAPLRVALIGVPNSGKTALFNRLTGSRQKVANYAGVTVERKEGSFIGPSTGRRFDVLDLPGAYSLTPTTLDEAITRDLLVGRLAGERAPDYIVCVADATNLRLNLRLVLDLKRLEIPLVLALNMSDLARKRGFLLDRERLAAELGVPVVDTVAVRARGDAMLVEHLEDLPEFLPAPEAREWRDSDRSEIEQSQRRVRQVLDAAGYREPLRHRALQRLDHWVMHPGRGPRHPRRVAVPDLPGRVQLGNRADEPDRRRRHRDGPHARIGVAGRDRCAAC
jgi:ferrous iron transport protein B